ncbi:MAG: hypothetical protein AB1468_02100 [Candidatus Micrarchaeota archaeon]
MPDAAEQKTEKPAQLSQSEKPSGKTAEAERRQAREVREVVLEPMVEGLKLSAKRVASVGNVIAMLRPLAFLKISVDGEQVVAVNVETRDIQKSPYLFSVFYLKPDVVELVYSVTPETSPRKRRVDVLRYFLDVISLLEDVYDFDHKGLCQMIGSALEEITEFASSAYNEIYAKYDNLKSDYAVLEKRVADLTNANEKLGLDSLDLKSKNDSLLLKVAELEKFSDDVLMVKIQEWLLEHKSEMDVAEFARIHKVSEARVEQVLNKMVGEGLLQALE